MKKHSTKGLNDLNKCDGKIKRLFGTCSIDRSAYGAISGANILCNLRKWVRTACKFVFKK